MFKPALPLAATAILALSGCAQSADSASRPSRAPAARVVGAGVSCIPITQIRSSRVHDDRTIDFEMSGSRVYRNTLPYSCPGLGFEQSFTYETSLSQLCSTDIIYALQRYGSDLRRGAGCGLGQFVRVELAR